MTIHDELQRIADRAPVADVPADTWSRGRIARKRDLALTIAGLAAALAVSASAIAWLPDHPEPPVASNDSLGVPDHLYAVPERMSGIREDGSWAQDEVTKDPTVIGVGAAAWVTNWGLPVVVGASDGAYHLLDLPDFSRRGTPVVALSPDGRDLAYGYAVLGSDSGTEPVPSGIRVVDLTTGALREIPVPGRQGTAVSRIEWSPDGTWLAFTGWQQSTWTAGMMRSASRSSVIGRVVPGSDEATVRSAPASGRGITINDRGFVGLDAGTFKIWTGTEIVKAEGIVDVPLDLRLGTTADGITVRFLDLEPGAAASVVLDRSGYTGQPVIDVPGEIAPSLSLATGLMTSSDPTVERPEPDWPWPEDRLSIAIGLGVAAVIAVLLGLRWLVRRYWPAR